jgi:hypothetical protein
MSGETAFCEIAGQPGYSVNRSGQIWSDKAGRVISGTLCGQMGYRAIQFPDGSRRYVHRIVCTAFHGPPPPGMQVRHLDGKRDNNSAVNLAWGTKQDNENDRKRHGTTAKGERNPQAKLNTHLVSKMRQMREQTSLSFKTIASRFGVTAMTAHRAITGQSWMD